MKTIETLVNDIYEVIETGKGWGPDASALLSDVLEATISRRLEPKELMEPSLRLSGMGRCPRAMWYELHGYETEPLRPQTKLKFLYGDLVEDLMIAFAAASGHEVKHQQLEVEVLGVKGHIDCIIDGVLIDVKTASHKGMDKFKFHKLEEDDPFGYISQISSYLYALQDHPDLKEKDKAGFLVVDKQNGEIVLDMYDLRPYLDAKEEEIERIKRLSSGITPPERPFEPVPEGKSGNMKLPLECSYCGYKAECWPNLRKFIYSKGPVYLTKVVKEPKVPEVSV